MDDLTKKKIGTNINAALANAKLKQKDLAKELKVTDNTVSYWCSGMRTPNTEQIIQIAKFLKVSTDYLLGLSNVATTDAELKAVCEYTGLTEDAAKNLHHSKILNSMFPDAESETTYLDTVNWILTDATAAESIMNLFWYKAKLCYLLQDQKELLKYLDSTDFDAIKFSDKYTELQHSYKNVRFYLFEALEKFRTAISKDSEVILNEYIQNDKLLHEKNEYHTIQFFNNKYESSDS